MIRPATLICMVLAAGSGLYLYQVKHQAQLLDEQIARILKDTDHARQRTGELMAEYALLNDPSRLQDLASAHLHLRPTEPTQFTSLAELSHRLPAPGAPPQAAPEPPADIAVPVAAAPAATPSAELAEATPAPAIRAKPSVVASVAPSPAPNPVVATVRPAKPRPSTQVYQPSLFGAPVQSAMLPPQRPVTRATLPPVLAAARAIRPVPQDAPPPSPIVGSALGMARSMPTNSVSGSFAPTQAGYVTR